MKTIKDKIKNMKELDKTGSIPGISIYMFSSGKEKYIIKGMQNIEKNIKLTKDSIWAVRSISKNIAATTVAWLVNQGKTSFDTKINHIIPIPFANKQITNQVTIKNALSHTTGLPPETGVFASIYNYDLSFIYKTIQYYPLSGFNQILKYSNLGFTLGFDTARKESHYNHINQPILEFTKLIGMNNVSIDTDIPDNLVVIPYLLKDNYVPQIVPITSPFEPAEDIFCTITDLATFVQFHLHKGNDIINENVLKQIYKPIVKSDTIGNGIEYGMGTSINYFNTQTVYGHGGVFSEGFTHQMLYDINNQIGVVVLTNTLSPVATSLAYYIYLTLLGDVKLAEQIYNEYYNIFSKLINSIKCIESPQLYNISHLTDLAGVYYNQTNGYLKIYIRNGTYYIKVGHTKSSKLIRNHANIHFVLYASVITPTAIINPIHYNNDIIGLYLLFNCNEFTYFKIDHKLSII